jgi:hypothetical protein
MTSTQTISQQDEIRVLDSAEVEYVTGGYMPSPVDMSQMPDRTVMCGTMWYLSQLGKIFTGRQH